MMIPVGKQQVTKAELDADLARQAEEAKLPLKARELTIWRGFTFGLGIALAFLLVEAVSTWVVIAVNDGKMPAVPVERGWR